jgi:hypothetical protein
MLVDCHPKKLEFLCVGFGYGFLNVYRSLVHMVVSLGVGMVVGKLEWDWCLRLLSKCMGFAAVVGCTGWFVGGFGSVEQVDSIDCCMGCG